MVDYLDFSNFGEDFIGSWLDSSMSWEDIFCSRMGTWEVENYEVGRSCFSYLSLVFESPSIKVVPICSVTVPDKGWKAGTREFGTWDLRLLSFIAPSFMASKLTTCLFPVGTEEHPPRFEF